MQYEDDDTTLTRTHKNYDDCLPLTPPHPPLPFSVIYSRPELFPPSNQWPIKKDSLLKIQKEKSEKIQCAVLTTHAR